MEVDLDEEDIKKKAASVDRMLEWRGRLDMAEAEAAVKKIKDAAESVNVGIKDIGDLISDLFRQLGQSGRWNESFIRDQIASENEMRRKQFELQEKLIGQQMDAIKINRNEKIEIQTDDDLFNDFFTSKCLEANDAIVSQHDILTAFIDWYTENHSSRYPSGTWLGQQLSKKYTKKKVNGQIVWFGIGLI